MADSILRLRVESSEYDQKIKRAAEGIQQYAQKCREAGGTLQYLDDGVLEFVQSLGKMDTVATGTKQQLREMSNALTTLTQTYRGLTDEEKASPFGQELAKGIQQLTERAGQAKDAMMDVEISIKNAASDTRLFDQMAQGASVITAGFQGLTGAGKLLGIEMGNDVEVIAKLQAAMAVTNSLTTIQTALQKESALMMGIASVQTKAATIAQSLLAKETIAATAAAKAFNLVAKANPIGLLVAGATTAIGAFTLLSSAFGGAKDEAEKLAKAEEEAKKKQEEYNKSLKDAAQNVIGNLYGKFITLRAEWNKLSDDASKTQWIKENTNAFKELGATISSISDAEDIFVRNSDAMVQAIMLRAQAAVLTKKIEKALENVTLEDNTPPPPSNRYVGNNDSDPYSSNSFSYDTPYQTAPDSGSRFNQMVARHYADELAEVNMQLDELMKKYKKNGGGTGGSGGSIVTQKELTETQQLQKNIEALTKEYQQLSDVEKVADVNTATGIEMRKAAIRGEIQTNQQRIDELKKFADEAQGKNISVKVNLETGISGTSEGSISAYVKKLQDELASIDYSVAGSFQKAININSNIIDANTLGNLLKTSIQQGIDLASAGIDVESMFDKIASGEGIEDADWKGFVEKINEQLKKQGIKLNIDPQTGNISTNISTNKKEKNTMSKALEKFNSDYSKLTGGVSSIVSGIQSMGVEIPKDIQSVLGVLTGISSIMSGIASILTVIEAATTIAAAKPFARGGIVHAAGGYVIPGNNFSGDLVPAYLNSQEMVLNKQQQMILAGTLENGGTKNITISGALRGEDIVLSADRWGKRTGKGELLFAKNL